MLRALFELGEARKGIARFRMKRIVHLEQHRLIALHHQGVQTDKQALRLPHIRMPITGQNRYFFNKQVYNKGDMEAMFG